MRTNDLFLTAPLLSSTFWATTFAAALKARDYSDGAIAQSTESDEFADCTSYLYYGESVDGKGNPRSCFAGAIVCALVNPSIQCHFDVGSSDFSYESTKDHVYIHALLYPEENKVMDMRGADGSGWICKEGSSAYGNLGITTYCL